MTNNDLSLKGSMFPLTVMDLEDHDFSSLTDTLLARIAEAPDFFKDATIVADCSALEGTIDFTALKQAIQEAGMYLIGASGLDADQVQQARAMHLPQFRQIGKKRPYQPSNTPKETADFQKKSSAETNNHQSTHSKDIQVNIFDSEYKAPKIIDGNVRGGQRLYAEDRDMIIFGNVSHGAEVIADGNIHIYGTLRGRALAGAQGDTKAVLCVSKIEAQLVSIAGYYKVLEDVKEYAAQGTMKISLDNTSINFKKLES